MADPWYRQNPPRLMGYESCLHQMPCIDRSGDVLVSVPLPGDADLPGEPLNRWLVALGDISGKVETASRLKDALETEVIRLVSTMTNAASILKALNHYLVDHAMEYVCATLLVAVIDGDRHELTIANAGHVFPLLRRVDMRVEFLAKEIIGFPLGIDRGQNYEHVTVPIVPGEVVIFRSDGVTAEIHHQGCNIELNSLRQAIAQAPNDAASVGQSILEAIRRYGQGRAQVDDITLLCLGRVVPTTLLGGEISG